jgi:hypothetical protein
MFESKLRVIIDEKTRGTSTGRCTITQGKAGIRDNPKEYVTRRWFAADYDELTPSQADNYLTNGRGSPHYERIIYFVIALKGDQRPCFAGSDDELSDVMRAATVEVMRELAAGVEAFRLVWVARTHPDYPNPCVKVLLRRDTGGYSPKTLKALPRRLRSRCCDAFLRVFDGAAIRRNDHA